VRAALLTEHLGYEMHGPSGAGTGNIRNGTRAETVLTDTTGHAEIEVPRDRAAPGTCSSWSATASRALIPSRLQPTAQSFRNDDSETKSSRVQEN